MQLCLEVVEIDPCKDALIDDAVCMPSNGDFEQTEAQNASMDDDGAPIYEPLESNAHIGEMR